MARGVPKNGFRMTKKRMASGWTQGEGGVVHLHNNKEDEEITIIKEKETVDQIDARISERFRVLTTMTNAAVAGKAPSMIVSGPPGLGKSFEVERIIKNNDPNKETSTSVKGYVRPTGLFRTLYNFRHKGNIIVFDDADSIFSDETSLNLLKAACDTSDERIISYLVETNLKDEEDEKIPKSFTFEGTIIFITNYDFDTMIAQGNKLAPHLQALISRTHYVDLMMKNRNDYLVRIKQVLRAGMLRNKGLSEYEEEEIVDFIEDNIKTLRELSLRMVLKLASIMEIAPASWEETARATCCKQR